MCWFSVQKKLPLPNNMASTETAEQETNTKKIMVQDRDCDPVQTDIEIPPVIQKTLTRLLLDWIS